MRIEILVGNSDEPLIYPINKPKLTIGSAETCDIIVNAANISRKHIQLVIEGDSYYVIDQGSTNGSFINEERLVPGRRTEFTSFFPVRLGEQVLITLLSDEEEVGTESALSFPQEEAQKPSGRNSEENTKMVSLRDLQKAKTSDLVERRQTIIKKKTSERAGDSKDKKGSGKPKSKRIQEKNHMNKIKFLVVVGIGIAAYVNLYVIEKPNKEVAQMGKIVPLDQKMIVKEPEKAFEPVFLVSEAQIASREKVQALMADIKCTLDTEKYFCDKIYKANETPYGVVQVGTNYFVLVDGEFFYEEAKKMLPLSPAADTNGQHTPEELKAYESNIHRVMAAIYILRALPKDMDPEKMKEIRFTIGLFRKSPEGAYNLEIAISLLPDSLKEIKRQFEETHITNIRQIGVSAIEFVERYYRVY